MSGRPILKGSPPLKMILAGVSTFQNDFKNNLNGIDERYAHSEGVSTHNMHSAGVSTFETDFRTPCVVLEHRMPYQAGSPSINRL